MVQIAFNFIIASLDPLPHVQYRILGKRISLLAFTVDYIGHSIPT